MARATVHLDTRDLMRRIRAAAAPIVQATAERILSDARKVWPVRTGRSRDSLMVAERSSGDMVRWVVGSTVPYAIYIRSTKIGKELDATRLRAVYTEHIQRPTRAARRPMAQAAVAAIAEAVTHG